MNMPNKATIIYKICDQDIWSRAVEEGIFIGTEIDLTDGFIHFSTRDHLASTLALHFAGRDNLVLVAVDAELLGEKVVFEEARGGSSFPHLYEPLAMKFVLSTKPLAVDELGTHIVPELEPDKAE